jgi:hypothetical protein
MFNFARGGRYEELKRLETHFPTPLLPGLPQVLNSSGDPTAGNVLPKLFFLMRDSHT